MKQVLPKEYLERMNSLLGDEAYNLFLASFDAPKYQGLRINTLKTSAEDLEKLNVIDCSKKVPWCSVGYYYSDEEGKRPTKNPFYYAGLYYIQEPSAMAPATILDIEPGDKVLDLCAAPGGKSTMLGTKLKGDGILVSNDISVSRTKALLKNIELFGIKNAVVTSEAPAKLQKYFKHYFDKILIDAPCSGEGMFRKDMSMIKNYDENSVQTYGDIQREIMPLAISMLKPGGLLLYSTCTFSPYENEGTIQAILDEYPDMEIVAFDKYKDFGDGFPESVHGHPSLKDTARLWPHKLEGEGHYVALLKKGEQDIKPNTFKRATLSKEAKELKDFKEFEKTVLTTKIDGILELTADKLYVIPEDLPNLKGLRLIRQGWLLGEVKKNRFEPSQAFAMGLRKNDVKNTLELDSEDPRVIKYLKGETIECDKEQPSGWTLVCIDGYPLGWGKCQKGKVKNKYYKGWRWQ